MAVSIAFDDQAQGDNAAGVAYVSTSFAPVALHRYILMLVYAHTSATPVVPTSVVHNGTGLTITRREDMAYKVSGSNRTAMAVYQVDAGASVTAGTWSCTWAAAMVGCGWTVVDLDAYGAVWANKAEHGGSIVNTANQTATLLAAPADTTTSRSMYFHSANGPLGWAPEAGWTELQELVQTNPSMTRMVAWNASAWDASATVTNGSGITTLAGMIAVELVPAPPAGLIPFRWYSWENGTNGNALTTDISLGVGTQTGTNTYTTDSIHGTLALRSTAGSFQVTHQTGVVTGIVEDGAGQVDMYWQPETVASACAFFRLSPSTGTSSIVQADTGGTISIVPVGGTTVTTTGTWTANQWHRISVRWTARVSNAYTVTARIYWTAESTTYEEISSAASTTAVVDRLDFGARGTGNVGVTDTIRVYPNVSSWPEPVNPSAGEDYSGSVALSGSGTVAPTGTPQLAATAALTGSGTLTTAGTPRPAGTLTTSGTGALTLAAVPRLTGALTTSGAGTLTTAGTPRPTGALATSGAGTLTASGTATEAHTGTVALTGSGTLTTAATPRTTGALGLTGTGTLTASGTTAVAYAGTAALSGTGTLTPAGIPRPAASAPLSGAGTLTGTGRAGVTGNVSLAGSGTLAVTAVPRLAGAVQLAGAGSLAGSGDVTITATVALTGTGTLTLTFFAGQLITPPDRVVTFPAVGRTVELEAVARAVEFPAVDRGIMLEPTGRRIEFPAETRELANA